MDIRHITDRSVIGANETLTVYGTRGKPERPPILALHGMWATNRRWAYYGQFFSKRGFPFYAPTLRHHIEENETNEALGKTSVHDYVSDIAKLIANLQKTEFGGRLPIVLGHSMGGLIAQKLAEADLASTLILLNSAPPAGIPLHADIRYQLAIARYLPELLMQKPFKPSFSIASRFIMNGLPQKKRLHAYAGMVAESGRAAWEIRFGKIHVDFSRVKCPALIIGCENDRITPPAIAHDIAKQITHENYLNWELKGFAHWPQAEEHWPVSATEILKWLIS